MKSLSDLLGTNQDWLYERVLSYYREGQELAGENKEEQHWYQTLAELIKNIVHYSRGDNCQYRSDRGGSGFRFTKALKQIIQLMKEETARNPGNVFRLIKYFRWSFLELVRMNEGRIDLPSREKWVSLLENYFDRLEITYCQMWTKNCQATDSSGGGQEELSQVLASTRAAVLELGSFKEAAEAIFNSCKKLTGATCGYIDLLYEKKGQNENVLLDTGGYPCNLSLDLPLPKRGLSGEACRMRQAIYHNRFSESCNRDNLPPGHIELENVLIIPLMLNERVVGLLGLGNKQGGFGESDIKVATALGELVAIALYNSRLLEKLEQSEEKFRSAIQTAGHAIVTIDANSNIIHWNDQASKIFGYPAEEIIGKPVTMLMPAHLRQDHQVHMEKLVSGENDMRIFQSTLEVTGLRKNGSLFPLEISLASWVTDGEMYFTGVMYDVTRCKMMEEELKMHREHLEELVNTRTMELMAVNEQLERQIVEREQAERQVRESEERYRKLIELSPDAIIIHDQEEIYFINNAGMKMMGIAGTEKLNKRLILDFIHPDSLDIVKRTLGLLEKKEGVFRVEQKLLRSDGEVIEVEVSSVPFLYQGKWLGQSVIRDITGRKQLEREKQEARDKIERATRVASLGIVAAGIAHEINQPLNSIKVLAGGLLYWYNHGKPLESGKIVDRIQKICRQIDRIDEIIKYCRSFARSKHSCSGQYSCSLNKAVNMALKIVGSQLSSHGIMVECNLDLELPEVKGEATMLEKVVINLLVNAMQALDTIEKRNKFISCHTYRKDNLVVLEVRDNGPGIPKENRHKIFEPFFTTKSVEEGMGLGLAIVKSVVEAFKGRIRVEENSSHGATFRVEFPFLADGLEHGTGR